MQEVFVFTEGMMVIQNQAMHAFRIWNLPFPSAHAYDHPQSPLIDLTMDGSFQPPAGMTPAIHQLYRR
jgi:hypothetical protein